MHQMLQGLTYNTRLRKNKEADYYSTEIRKEMVEKSTILILIHLQTTNYKHGRTKKPQRNNTGYAEI
jgi:hypothetical protein